MKFVSLFAGIGGFDLGFTKAGMTCAGMVEIDKKAQSVLSKHFPEIPLHSDVRTAIQWAQENNLKGNVDLVCGGFPCQDLSIAGKRAGLAGERSGLFYEAVEFAKYVGARWIVLENVPGLFSSNQRRDFATVIREIRNAGFSYVEWRVFDSQFYGVPQRRRRVYIVGHIGDPARFPVFSQPESSEGNSAQKQRKRKSTSGNSGAGIIGALTAGDEKGVGNQYVSQEKLIIGFQNYGYAKWKEGTGTVRASGGDIGGGSENLVIQKSEPYVKVIRSGARDSQGNLPAEVWRNVETAPTLNLMDNAGESRATVIIREQLKGVRRLTPLECERLQGFPDNWTAGQADTNRYKQIGNAVTVNVAQAVAEFIMKAESNEL